MILYHGSFLEIAKPDLVHSRPNVDFGRGFYVTPLYEQATKWCGKFKRRGKDSTDYDLVVGGVANDKVFNTVELFFDGLIDKWKRSTACIMKSRTCKYVSAQRKHCLCYILKGVKHYDSEPDFVSEKI